MKKKFKYSVENFRGIAIIFVMLSHLTSYTTLGVTGKYLHFLFADATTWFVFISGYLFSYIESGDNFNYAKYLFKKFKYVITPYLILSIPAILAGFYLSRPALIDVSPYSYIAWSLIVGGSVIVPMWFIPMIAIFFLFSPLFNRLKSGFALTALTLIFIIFSIISARPYLNTNPLLSFIHFLGFYLLGILSFKTGNKIDSISKSRSTLIIIFGYFVFSAAAIITVNSPQENLNETFYNRLFSFNPMQIGKLALLISTFLFFEKLYDAKNKYLGYLAQISFGLFFIHGFFMAIFVKFIAPYTNNNPTRFIIEFLIIIAASIIATIFAKNILKGSSRYVIGC